MFIMDGVETTRQICDRFSNTSNTKVLILSVDETEKYVSLAGASGYILKNTSPINTQIIEPKPWERFEVPLQKLTKI